MTTAFGVETVELDLAPLVGGFGRRLHDAGVPVEPERAVRFAAALRLVRPVARRRLYWTARAVFVSDPGQVRIFDRVFAEVFGTAGGVADAATVIEDVHRAPGGEADERPVSELPRGVQAREEDAWGAGAAPTPSRGNGEPDEEELPVGVLASDEEVMRTKRFDTLDADELAALYRLMSRIQLAAPLRRTRRAERRRHGETVDMRRTLRGSLRTGGDPIRLAHRRRRIVPRRLVLLCDISGSMEPYARAYLQFLTCAAGGGDRRTRSEAFVFATRLTRLTRALHSRNPERAIQRAAATAPDWSSGTRIGDALKTFNDRHGRRGMARGAVVVILSDGWERGDPALVAREMERLERLAYRIIWVNPRAAAAGFAPRAGGMAAALPHCDALVSGHSLEALDEVVEAIRARRADAGDRPQIATAAEPEEESWPSATPVPGSSVAMPSGYGPSRGRTTPGWSLGR
ncbi:MAG TPA: VWA domain-containing protein [Solirubrobacteraceae bacterium]|nr:VWA domain-containing protein [Solirubrobacteraceae bacterium]